MIRVLIADDHALARAGLATLLGSEPEIDVVGVASDGNEAIELAETLRPDIACLDVRMPGRDGISVAQHLCGPQAADPIPVLVLTTFDLDEYVFGALEAGVSGFLLKDSEPATIINAVQQVAAGRGTLDQQLTRRVLQEFVQRRNLRPARVGRAVEMLTDRESDILLLLAEGMSNDDIAQQLVLEVSTVKSHLARMLPKIGVRSRLQAVVWAYQNGVVTAERPQ